MEQHEGEEMQDDKQEQNYINKHFFTQLSMCWYNTLPEVAEHVTNKNYIRRNLSI